MVMTNQGESLGLQHSLDTPGLPTAEMDHLNVDEHPDGFGMTRSHRESLSSQEGRGRLIE